MNNKSLSRLLALLLSVLIVLSMTACGSKEKAPANAVGNVNFTVDEAKVDINGNTTKGLGGARVEHNKFKLVPGRVNSKDTTVHMDSKSAECWLFAKVDNGIASVESQAADYVPVAAQLEANGWVLLQDNIYAYNTTAKASDNIVIMNAFAISEDAAEEDCKALTAPEITVYGVEAAGYDSAEGAWNASGFGA